MKTPYGEAPEGVFGKEIMRCMSPKTIQQLIARELAFFKVAGGVPWYDGPGRFHHFKEAANGIWRTDTGRPGWKEAFVWHPDLEAAIEEYCGCGPVGEVILTGPASDGKTFGAALYALIFWMCSPGDTGILGCSTTLRGLKERLWSEIRMLYTRACMVRGEEGRKVDSDVEIQSYKGATKHGIFGIAVGQGEEEKAINRIIGFHPRRVLVIGDELPGIPWAIIKALTNLFTAKQKAQFIGLGNASFFFDSHGRMCEPKEGWNSVNVDSERWDTKRGGVCLHFDGFKNPNVKSGKVIFPFLLTQDDIDKTANEYGYDSPDMWRMRRGFWPPEGSTKTVLNDSLIRKFMAMEPCIWEGPTILWAALDPAFEGGDRCVLRFARTGRSDSGVDTIEFEKPEVIKVSVSKKENLHYQIAREVRERCIARAVDVRNFGMDVTGEGGGLASIIAEEWSPGFNQVEFGGKPSEMPVSEINRKSCRDEYFDRVTELWFAFRTALMQNQVRGLDPETAAEFCSRLYVVDGKTWVESKREMKSRPGSRSPDLADAAVILVNTAKTRGGLGKVITRVQQMKDTAWREVEKQYEEADDDYSQDPISAVL
jgi:hypothetical protein